MASSILAAMCVLVLGLSFVAWRRYLRAAQRDAFGREDTCQYSLNDVFGDDHLVSAPHQHGIQWLTEVFARSARKYPHLTALQIPHTGESLTFAELDAQAERVAAVLSRFLTGPDQVVAIAMSQDNWHVVAAHLGVLKAGGTLMFLDVTLPEALVDHMLDDARPVVVLTRGQAVFRDLPTLDILSLPETAYRREPPTWMDDPAERLAAIFYTSGTTGMPKGVDCPHAGYVNLALGYADYFDLIPGLDATTLSSSLGYDGSISEMYSAWVSGCAVVMLTKEQMRSGPDLVTVLREAEVTVLFCPPVLLTTLTSTPEVDLPYPICRYIVPAGEAFPNSLVEPWTRGKRQIINTYGPTEASTDTSRQSLRPGETVTIGSPFANVTYVILEIDQLRPLPHGEIGELCIGGVHLARGYRNLPDLTARKFVSHPQFGRLYRTGDRCKIDPRTHRVHFLGRTDAQLKVRGHRVEPHAVEHLLQTRFREIDAAVVDYQNGALIAFVAAPSVSKQEISTVVSAPPEWAARVTTEIAKRLPPPSVPSRIILVEQFAMNPVSGKIDRNRLPNLAHLLNSAAPESENTDPAVPTGAHDDAAGEAGPPDTNPKSDTACEEVLAICRAVLDIPVGLDDGFAEAGGHSIAIARLAQRLQSAGWPVSVRALLTDVNTARLVARLTRTVPQDRTTSPEFTRSSEYGAERDESAAQVFSIGYFTTLQILFAVLLYLPAVIVFVAGFKFAGYGTLFTTSGLGMFILVACLLYLLAIGLPFAALLWVMLINFFVGGSFRGTDVTPGVYPKWSRMHLRVWCIGRMQDAVLRPLGRMYRSAPLMAFVLRRLGATVGCNLQCAHDASVAGPLNLLSIEDNVAIQTGAYIHTTRWSGQSLHVGPVRLKRGCKVGMRAAIANHVTVGRGSWITPFTAIRNDVGSREIWEGSPARPIGRVTTLNRTASACRSRYPVWLAETLNIFMQTVLSVVLKVIPAAVIFFAIRTLIPALDAEFDHAYVSITQLLGTVSQLGVYAFITTWSSFVVTAVLGCLFIRWTAGTPGLYPSQGLRGALLLYRTKMMNAIQERWTWTITGQYLRALAGVRFPRVGGSECDLMFNLVPEFVSADSQVFWSNGSFTNMLDYGAEHIKVRPLDMPRNFFSGNNSVAESGQFPTNFLLGVSTPVSDIQFRRQMWSRLSEPITVAGNPPVRFASASIDKKDEGQQLPRFPLFLMRVSLNDCLGIGFLPIAEVLIFTIVYFCLSRLGGHSVVCAAVSLVVTEGSLVLCCVVLKALLVGRKWGSDHTIPFWSSMHFAYFFVQDCFFAWCRRSLRLSAGTILSNPILRLMGCRIGRRTIINDPLQCSDWNAVSFGDDCVMHGLLQLHTFEYMILRVKRTHIGDGCSIDFGATVMGGALTERDTVLLPLSLVLKEMRLPTGVYEGSPTELAGEVHHPSLPRPSGDPGENRGESARCQETG